MNAAPHNAPGSAPVPRRARHAGGLWAIAILPIVLACLLIPLGSSMALLRGGLWDRRWRLRLAHAIAEARLRTASTWRELTDWARLGR